MAHTTPGSRSDVILPMMNKYMEDIVRTEKNYEFRRYRIASSVQRIWFYLNAPFSHIAYVCEIDPARTRDAGDPPLDEDGLGNAEFNTQRDGEWERYDYAYRIRSVWRIKQPINLKLMKDKYGIKGAPRGLIYVPPMMASEVLWDQQLCIWESKVDTASSFPPSDDVPMEAPAERAPESADDLSASGTRGAKRKEGPRRSSDTSPKKKKSGILS
ncbi:hypothetical protein B0H10DRAFT_1781963 [Mycena sp. CBHHK59/15]|nr:hypothetical protein B0H10DRAFT_1781963 [Mycena sp. CBHHK59/15]